MKPTSMFKSQEQMNRVLGSVESRTAKDNKSKKMRDQKLLEAAGKEYGADREDKSFSLSIILKREWDH